jgi:GrpB-like predicted nucleotidyltransferase (UPF0157 family)
VYDSEIIFMLLENYNPSWPEDFRKIKETILANISISNLKIEHIGSTSVENLASKPIIDIDIVYEEGSNFKIIKAGLENLGYYHNGNQGVTGREVFKRTKQTIDHFLLDTIPHHLYVCHITNDEYNRHVIFRNFLRSNEKARMEYERLKRAIAVEAMQERKKYAQLKEEKAKTFIEKIILGDVKK